jgi:Recombination endonuclease VII
MSHPGLKRKCRKCGTIDRYSDGTCRPCSANRPCRVCGGFDRSENSGRCDACNKRLTATPTRRKAHNRYNQGYRLDPSYRAAERSKQAAYIRQQKTGLSHEAQAALFISQDGKCASCSGLLRPGWYTHLDHDHSTGAVRGFLCGGCNTAEGLLGGSPERCEALAAYLRRHQRLHFHRVARSWFKRAS